MSVATSDGSHYGEQLRLRLGPNPDGSSELTAVQSSWSHLGQGSSPIEALHGIVTFERRSPGSGDPIKVRFLVSGARSSRGSMGSALDVTRGDLEIEIPPEVIGDWERLLGEERTLSTKTQAASLITAKLVRLDGSPVAEGQVDGLGQRWGRWVGFYRNGIVAWQGDYRHGLLHGQWRGFRKNGNPLSIADVSAGLRHGQTIYIDLNGAESVTNWVRGEVAK